MVAGATAATVKVFLLAAGLGTRLRPLTDRVPKCLIEVEGMPLLGRWLTCCRQAGVDAAFVNTHHLVGQVVEYLGRLDAWVAVTVRHEDTLLGSAGTVCANLDWVGSDRDFLVVYVDNYAALDLTRVVVTHRRTRADLTMVVGPTEIPEQKGLVELSREGRVVAFAEKPRQPVTNLMNCGIYVVSAAFAREVMAEIGERRPSDFGYDVLPGAVARGRVYAHRLGPGEFVTDIGTMEDYVRIFQRAPA